MASPRDVRQNGHVAVRSPGDRGGARAMAASRVCAACASPSGPTACSATSRTIGSVLLARTSSQPPGQSSLRPSSRLGLGRRKGRRDPVEAGRQAGAAGGRREGDLRLLHHEPRQPGGQVGHRREPLAARTSARAPAPSPRRCRGRAPPAGRSRRRCPRRRARRRVASIAIHHVGLAHRRDVAGHADAGPRSPRSCRWSSS